MPVWLIHSSWRPAHRAALAAVRRIGDRGHIDGESTVVQRRLGGGRGLDLLLHVATLIGQLDYELCHGRALRLHTLAQPEILEESLQIKGNSTN